MDILKALDESQSVLLLVSGRDYSEAVLETARQLSGGKVCYVTLNKTFKALDESLARSGVDTSAFFFIDAILPTLTGETPKDERCAFVTSPASLTELAIAISSALGKGYGYLVFDSLTNLLVYEGKAPVAKFLSGLVNKIRRSKTKAVFLALAIDQHSELIEEASMFVDRVIDLEKKG